MMINYSNNQYMIEDTNSKISLSQKKKKNLIFQIRSYQEKKKGCQSISLETIFWKFFVKKKKFTAFYIFNENKVRIFLKWSIYKCPKGTR